MSKCHSLVVSVVREADEWQVVSGEGFRFGERFIGRVVLLNVIEVAGVDVTRQFRNDRWHGCKFQRGMYRLIY